MIVFGRRGAQGVGGGGAENESGTESVSGLSTRIQIQRGKVSGVVHAVRDDVGAARSLEDWVVQSRSVRGGDGLVGLGVLDGVGFVRSVVESGWAGGREVVVGVVAGLEEGGRAVGMPVLAASLRMDTDLSVVGMANQRMVYDVAVQGSRRAGIAGVGMWDPREWGFEGGFGSILALSFLRIYFRIFALSMV
jgi:hypothetical protein